MKFKTTACTSIKFPPRTKVKQHHLVQHIRRKTYTLPIIDTNSNTSIEFNIFHDTILDPKYSELIDNEKSQPQLPFSIVVECKEGFVRQGFRFSNGHLMYVDVMDTFRYKFPKDLFEHYIEHLRLQSIPNKVETLYYWILMKGSEIFHVTMTDNYDDNPVIFTIYYEVTSNFYTDICLLLHQIMEFYKNQYMTNQIIVPKSVSNIMANISYFHDLPWSNIDKCEFDDMFIIIRDAFEMKNS